MLHLRCPVAMGKTGHPSCSWLTLKGHPSPKKEKGAPLTNWDVTGGMVPGIYYARLDPQKNSLFDG